MATLTEIETTWNLDDILRADAMLSYESDLMYLQTKKGKGR